MRQVTYPLAVTLMLTTSGHAVAQSLEESGGLLVDFLEDTLSGEGRNIRVRGLSGALSAKATIEEITVADDDGVWLTIRDAALDWNRLALIRGRFSVNALTAAEIRIDRAPLPGPEQTELPDAAATPFQLPELPVAIELGEVRVDKLALGAALAGMPADLSVLGKLTLADGTLDSALDIERLDRRGDQMRLVAGFTNETSQIKLDVAVTEDAGGLISTSLGIPGTPALQLTAAGEGPVSDFTADIALASEGAERVAGQVRLQSTLAEAGAAQPGTGFTADLGGDLTPFLEAEFDPFFGTETRLFVTGVSHSDGALDLDEFTLSSQALRLEGEMAMAAGGLLQHAAVQGRIMSPEGDRVVLPVAGPRITLESAQVSGLYDRANGDGWVLNLTANEVDTPELRLGRARFAAEGTLTTGPEGAHIGGDLQSMLAGLIFADPALNRAVGTAITLNGQFDLPPEQSMTLRAVELKGADFAATVDAVIDGLTSGFAMDGKVTLVADDLSRFSDLAGQALGGSVNAELTGKGTPLSGSFDFVLDAEGMDLSSGRAEIDPLIAGRSTIRLDAVRDASGMTVRDFRLDAPAVRAEAAAMVTQPDGILTLDGRARVEAPDLAPFSALAGRDLTGTIAAEMTGKATQTGETFDLVLDVDGRGLSTGMAEIDPLIAGPVTLHFDASRDGDSLNLRKVTLDSRAATADVEAEITGLSGALAVDGKATVSAPRLAVFSGLAGRDLGGSVQAELNGRAQIADQTFDMRLDLDATDLRAGIAQLDKLIAGRTRLHFDGLRDGEGLDVRAFTLEGSALSADARGSFRTADSELRFKAALDDLARVTPAVSGPLKLAGTVSPTPTGIRTDVSLNGPDSSFARLDGTVDTDGTADLNFDAELARLERFVPDLPGSLTARGTADRSAGVWTISGRAQGPAGITAEVAGSFDETSGLVDMTTNGQLSLGVANKALSPNKIDGTARFDVAMKGTPGLAALTGTITTSGTTLAIPGAGQTITGIGGTVRIADQSAQISLNGGVRAGGSFTVSGPVSLLPPFDGRITVALNDLVMTDNLSYDSRLGGQITLSGPLTGNSSLSGQINVGETNINLNTAGGAAGAAAIPDIVHSREPAAVFATRQRANLVDTGNGGGGNSAIALDISIDAPGRVYARGRGLNAEMGGRIHIGGTSAAPVPSGQIGLIRGDFNIFSRRLNLTKGIVTLQGDLTPFVEFASTTTTSEGQASLQIIGPLDAPEIKVIADPDRPSEEALAMLLFGNQFAELSPFVIAQMAASLATLSGAGGDATKGVRKATGADTIEVGADTEGRAQLGAGAYLGENLYTDFTVNTSGDTEVNLNLDVTDNLTLKGTVDNAGDTSVGIFFERDY
ncbi:translocation/assembly module TamB domain-containing protein [Ruegeria marina]|uniref:Autotransporter secretion inner membrane protein TamB n=1 Tax=Ruegeria marina TaxID=639004 RepID=A0A1G6T881_9RHOB|nr:translocation/assembly module TamB domain-containing protein [Ruegeria marina]SDD25248.1 autotransporter secretion inner membrane protein TamB [Ruegeria marina]